MLSVAQKNYDDHMLSARKSDGNIAKARRHLRVAVQAHENNSKKQLIKSLKKAYLNLPHTKLGTQIAADIVESYLQVQAYDQVITTAEQMERQGYYMAADSYTENFDLFRIFANKAEAHDALGELDKARLAREKALDYQLESNPNVDVEMLQLFSK